MVDTEFFADAATFADAVRPLIQADPVGATIFAGVLENQIAAPFPGAPPLLVAVTDDDRVVAAALRIPRYPMTIVIDPDIVDPASILDELAAAVVARTDPIPGIGGRRGAVEQLARQWAARTGVTPTLRMPLLYHRLGALVQPDGVPGVARTASVQDPVDVDLLARWWFEFEHETGANAHAAAPAPDPDAVLRGADRGQVVIIWSDEGRPVAAAGHSPVRAGSAKIAPVYTPRDFRRHGYGAAVTVAAVRSAQALGASEISLFTDATYGPANALYRQLGFRVEAEFAEFEIPVTADSQPTDSQPTDSQPTDSQPTDSQPTDS